MTTEEMKRATGFAAADQVQSDMIVGLGSGSTARYATLRIAERLRTGDLANILAVPTSEETAALARSEGIPLTTLEEHGRIDLTIDGADEVDSQLNLIKGLGGCLLREKIVAYATARQVIVVDESKLVLRLGTLSPVPVEVIQFGWRNTEAALKHTGARTALRMRDGAPYITDEGNYIVDCWYDDGLTDPTGLSCELNGIPGVVEHGLFLGITKLVVVASRSGLRMLE